MKPRTRAAAEIVYLTAKYWREERAPNLQSAFDLACMTVVLDATDLESARDVLSYKFGVDVNLGK